MMRHLKRFGPILPRPGLRPASLAALGAAFGLVATAALLWLGGGTGPWLDHPGIIAPFAASAVLIFAVPASPLSQPWNVVMGNSLAGACGLAALALFSHPLTAMAAAVLAALVVTALARALHPPAGAVAAFVTLAAAPGSAPNWASLASPILAGSLALVATGILWHWLTGGNYPHRVAPQPAAPQPVTPPALAELLVRLHLEATITPEDLAQLLGEAEKPHLPLPTALQMMTRAPVTLAANASQSQAVTLFRQTGFKALPIVTAEGHLLAILPAHALLAPQDPGAPARALAPPQPITLPPSAGLAEIIAALRLGPTLAVTAKEGQLLGLITRSDLIAALVRMLGPQNPP